jgi:hypothetical protein
MQRPARQRNGWNVAVVSSTARAAAPGAESATRSWLSWPVTIFHPWCSRPTRMATGTRTSSKNVALVRVPASVRIGVTDTPSDFMSTHKMEMP